MIGFNIAELVAIIDHYSKGLTESRHRIIGEKINPLNACTIAEMEARYPIKRLIRLITRQQQIPRRKPG